MAEENNKDNYTIYITNKHAKWLIGFFSAITIGTVGSMVYLNNQLDGVQKRTDHLLESATNTHVQADALKEQFNKTAKTLNELIKWDSTNKAKKNKLTVK